MSGCMGRINSEVLVHKPDLQELMMQLSLISQLQTALGLSLHFTVSHRAVQRICPLAFLGSLFPPPFRECLGMGLMGKT